MKITILTVGKIENEHAAALADIYLKRIKHYFPIHLEIIKPEKMKSLPDSEILHREGQKILEKLSKSEQSIVLDKEGKQQTSEEFAQFLNRLAIHRSKQITFIFGGPLGLAEEVKKQAKQLMSFSAMTFPHELAVVLVLEQIYRACTILRGENYHK